MPEIEEVLETLARKRGINAVVNEATDQIATGIIPFWALRDSSKTASPEEQAGAVTRSNGKKITPPVGVHIPSLPSINRELNGSTASSLFRASQRPARVHSDYRLESVSAWNGRYYTMTLSKVKRSW